MRYHLTIWRKGKGSSARHSPKGDARAQMSFSMVAVLILLISSVSLAMVSQSHNGTEGSSISSLQRMDALSEQVAKECEAAAYTYALALVTDGTLDCNLVQAYYPTFLDQQLTHTFPRNLGGYIISVNCSDIHLDVLTMSTGDSLGFEVGSNGTSGTVTTPAYLTLTGMIKVNVSRSMEFLVTDHDVDRGVYLPAPLLEGRLDRYQHFTEGGSSLLWRTVHSELSAFLQLRLLTYGSIGPRAIEDILTETDARNAYALATILLQVACFRTCDPKLFDSIHSPRRGRSRCSKHERSVWRPRGTLIRLTFF